MGTLENGEHARVTATQVRCAPKHDTRLRGIEVRAMEESSGY